MAPAAENKGLDLELWYAPIAPARLVGDPGRIRQVLINLVGNAIKFTDAGRVLVELECVDCDMRRATLQCSVHDTGIGIAKDKLPMLFKKFTQLDASVSKRYEGTGLGLAISDHLVHLMGGEIQVASEPEEGSTFQFTMRLEIDQEREKPTIPTTDLEGVRVLIADDSEIGRAVLTEQCRRWEMDVEEADSGSTTMSRLMRAREKGSPYRLVILGHQMPDMDGEQVVREIRRRPELSDTAVVLLTSVGRRGEGTRYRKAGCDAYLVKPVRESVLHDTMAGVLGAKEAGVPVGMMTVYTLKESQQPELQPPAQLTGYRALIVEDNLINQKVGLRFLSKLGMLADVASSGAEALEKLERTAYDVVLMDCQMPGLDGFETTRRLREREGGRERIPVIAMTAHAMPGDRRRCMRAGMDEYISKPFSLDRLRLVLSHFLPVRPNNAP